MIQLVLIRVENSPSGLIGVLLINGVVECFTIQPDSTDDHFSIPPGFYECRRFHGAKYKDTFEIIVKDHTALLFHIGNIEDHSEGCIILGESVGYLNDKRAVLSSGLAFEQFMKRMGDTQKCNLLIIDLFL